LLKVLYIVDYYPFYAGRVVYEIAKRLSKNEVFVKVVSSNFTYGPKNYEPCGHVVRLRAKRIVVGNTPFVIYDLRDLGLLKKQLDADIVHVHFLYSILSLYIGAMKKLNKIRMPIVATSHGLTSGYYSSVVQLTAKLLNELSKKLVIANASAITTVSILERNFLAKFISKQKLYYIPNGVDTSIFKPDDYKRRKLREKLGIDEGDIVVLYFTHLRAAKGVFTFLKAMNRVIKRTAGVKFIVAGSGPLARQIMEIEEKFNNRVYTFLGYLPDEDLPYLYNACDVYVLPSYVEGMPLSVMEAMACGKPVIVSSVGDLPFMVENGINGIVIPPGNADMLAESIIYLAENPELRKRVGEKNIRKMAKYDWDKIAKQYYSLFSEMLRT